MISKLRLRHASDWPGKLDMGSSLCMMRFLSTSKGNAEMSHSSHVCFLLMNNRLVSIANDARRDLTDNKEGALQ